MVEGPRDRRWGVLPSRIMASRAAAGCRHRGDCIAGANPGTLPGFQSEFLPECPDEADLARLEMHTLNFPYNEYVGGPPEPNHSQQENRISDTPVHTAGHHAELGHPANACKEVEGKKNDVDERQILQQQVHVVVDDASTSFHETGEHRREDLRLTSALFMFDDDVVDHLDFVLRKSDLLSACADLGKHQRVGLERVQVVDEAFAEREHLEQIAVFHGQVELRLQLGVDLFDDLEVPQKMVNRVEEEFERYSG